MRLDGLFHFALIHAGTAVHCGGEHCAHYAHCALGCFRKTLFQKNKKRNPPSISLGVSLNRSKRIFDFDQV